MDDASSDDDEDIDLGQPILYPMRSGFSCILESPGIFWFKFKALKVFENLVAH